MKKAQLERGLLISRLLSVSSEKFSNHGCNDLPDGFWNGISEEYKKNIVFELQEGEFTKEELEEDWQRFVNQADWVLMSHFKRELKQEFENQPTTEDNEIQKAIEGSKELGKKMNRVFVKQPLQNRIDELEANEAKLLVWLRESYSEKGVRHTHYAQGEALGYSNTEEFIKNGYKNAK